MAYRHDPDLEFLGTCSSEELEALVKVLTYDDKDNKKRWTENLTGKTKYKRYYPQHNMYWKEIAEELQRFGGNTFSNVARKGQGVLYREILLDVCKKLDIELFDSPLNRIAAPVLNIISFGAVGQIEKSKVGSLTIEKIELCLLENLTKRYIESLEKNNPEELKKIAERMDIKDINNLPYSSLVLAINSGLSALFSMSVPFAINLVYNPLNVIISQEIVTTSLGALLSSTTIGKFLVRFNPIVAGIMAAWTINDIAGPAMRVTIPATAQIALLRSIKAIKQQETTSSMDEELEKSMSALEAEFDKFQNTQKELEKEMEKIKKIPPEEWAIIKEIFGSLTQEEQEQLIKKAVNETLEQQK